MPASEPGNIVIGRMADDAGEDPVGLVGQGLQQLSGGETPQLDRTISRARDQEISCALRQGDRKNRSCVKPEPMPLTMLKTQNLKQSQFTFEEECQVALKGPQPH